MIELYVIYCVKGVESVKNKAITVVSITIIIMTTVSLATWILSHGNNSDLYANLLSGVGTILLGLVAWLQNEKIQEIERKSNIKLNSCNIMIRANYEENKWVLSNQKQYSRSQKYIDICFQNYSDAFLKSVDIYFGKCHFSSYITLANGESKIFKIYLPEDECEYTNKVCNVVFTSCYNEKTYADFEVAVDSSKSKAENTYKNDNRMIIKHYHFYGTEQLK